MRLINNVTIFTLTTFHITNYTNFYIIFWITYKLILSVNPVVFSDRPLTLLIFYHKVDKLINNRDFAGVDIFNSFLEKKINTTIIYTKFYM